MAGKYFFVIATLCTTIFTAYVMQTSKKATFSCAGAYHTEITVRDTRLTTTTNISISFFRQSVAYVTFEGAVTQNGREGHLYREIWYHYEPVDKKSGLYRIHQTRSQKGGTDTTHAAELDNTFLGIEKEGRLIRIWKLSDKVLLIGNAFSPVMSCTRLN